MLFPGSREFPDRQFVYKVLPALWFQLDFNGLPQPDVARIHRHFNYSIWLKQPIFGKPTVNAPSACLPSKGLDNKAYAIFQGQNKAEWPALDESFQLHLWLILLVWCVEKPVHCFSWPLLYQTPFAGPQDRLFLSARFLSFNIGSGRFTRAIAYVLILL